MKSLPTKNIKKEYTYTLVERDEDRAIYSQSRGQKIYAYEVFIIKKQNAGKVNFGGNLVDIEDKEKFPKNEDFGKTAWTYKTIDEARKKFLDIWYW